MLFWRLKNVLTMILTSPNLEALVYFFGRCYCMFIITKCVNVCLLNEV